MKYEPATVEKICGLIAGGVPSKHAALSSGISEPTFYRWIRENATFDSLIKKAESDRVASLVIQIKQDPSWVSKAWLLERLHREIFSLPTAAERGLVERLEKIESRLNGDKLNGASTNRKDLDAAAIN